MRKLFYTLFVLAMLLPSVAFAGGREALVTKAFVELIGRYPKTQELTKFTQRAWKKPKELYGVLVTLPDRVTAVHKMYQNILGRKARKAELNQAKKARITLHDIQENLLNGPERLRVVKQIFQQLPKRKPTAEEIDSIQKQKMPISVIRTLLKKHKTIPPPVLACCGPLQPSPAPSPASPESTPLSGYGYGGTPTPTPSPEPMPLPGPLTTPIQVKKFAVDIAANPGATVCLPPIGSVAKINLEATITADIQPKAQFYTYQWELEDPLTGKVTTRTDPKLSLEYPLGIYTVSLTTLYEKDPLIAAKATTTLHIRECFRAELNAAPSQGRTVPLTASFSVTLLDHVVPTRQYQYEWTFGDGTTQITDESSVRHRYGAKGSYQVKVVIRTKDTLSQKTDEETTEAATTINIGTQFTLQINELMENVGIGPGFAPVYYDFDVSVGGTEKELDYTWDFGDGTVWTEQSRELNQIIQNDTLKLPRLKVLSVGKNTRIGYIYKDPGTYILKVTATIHGETADSTNTVSAIKMITVKRNAPTWKVFVFPKNTNTEKNVRLDGGALAPRHVLLYDTVWNQKIAEGETGTVTSSGTSVPGMVFTSGTSSSATEVTVPFVDHMTYTTKAYCSNADTGTATSIEGGQVTWGISPRTEVNLTDKRVCGGYDY